MAVIQQATVDKLYQFFTAAFDGAAGVVYMNQLVAASNSGMTIPQIVNVFTGKPQFLAMYPESMSSTAFGLAYAHTLIGDSASPTAVNSVAADIALALDNGMSRGDVIFVVFTKLAAMPTNDPTWGQTSKMFQNQLVVSKYYTEVMLGQETALPYLQNVISQVDGTEVLTTQSGVPIPAAIEKEIGSAPGLANITLTPNQDSGGIIFNGSIFSDTFLATQSTLQLGDSLNGGNGSDTLSLTIGGSGGLITGFATESIETIKVKSLSTGASTLDLSDAKGPFTLYSYETDGAALTFHDIQSINATSITVVDTDEAHTFQYDVGNSATNADVAKIAIQELRDASITLENNGTPGQSFVDEIDLNSAVRADPGVQPSNTYKNTLSLVAGDDLDKLIITGDEFKMPDGTVIYGADLKINNVLDKNINLVDASAHTGAADGATVVGLDFELDLNLSNSDDGVAFIDDGKVPTLTLKGSQGDNHIDFGLSTGPDSVTTNNDKIVTLYGGNDWLRTSTGEAKVDLGAGNDSLMAGALNDSVNAGSGDDKITDNGSNYEGWKNGDSVSGVYYVPDYVAGGNYYDLGAGNDSLNVVADDSLQGSGFFSLNTVSGGADNDVISIHGSAYPAQSGSNWTGLTGYNSVDLGTGNDVLTVGDNQNTDTGHNSVIGGAGNDNIAIWQDGNQTVDAGGNDDTVVVGGKGSGDNTVDYTNGNHNIELGDGNDQLTVWGTSKTQNGVTTINAGSGDDYIYIEKDHVLRSNLGDGADTLQMRARDLMSEDTIVGGNTGGYDTIKLSNVGGDLVNGLVRKSETTHTTQIEEYWLQNSGIRLDLTDNMFETAQDNSITVNTTESDATPTLKTGYFNAMTRAQYDALGPYGVQENVQVQFTGLNQQGPVYFIFTGVAVTQTVDMTAVTTPDFHFTLVGGSQRDIVIGSDATINGQSILDFDAAPDNKQAWNPKDTLVVVNGAEITTSDLRNVTNMERIELTGASNVAQTWHVELNTRVINQTTGVEKLYIVVNPDTAAGSKVYITVGEDGWAGADTDVIVVRNSNVKVYVNGVLVSSPVFDSSTPVEMFNGAHGLYVVTDYLFTTNPDNLVGDSGPNTFYASSVDQVQASDNVDGGNGSDTVKLGFGLANQSVPLANQLDHPNLVSIEKLWFDTETEVRADGFENPYTASFMNAWATGLQTVVTGSGADRLTDMNRSGLSWELNQANDAISFDAVVHGGFHGSGVSNADTSWTLYNFYATVDGGSGYDSVSGANNAYNNDGVRYTNNGLVLSHVETVSTWSGNDTIRFAENSGDTYVYAGRGFDSVSLDDDGTAGVVYIEEAETIIGGDGADNINARIWNTSSGSTSDSMVIWGDGGDLYGDVYGSDDTIYARGVSANGSGEAANVSVYGQGGNDSIDVDTNDSNADDWAYVDGGNGNDTIKVGQSTPDYVTVYGGSGQDSINVLFDYTANVSGGADADYVKVYGWAGGGIATVYGDGGNDTIDVYASQMSVYGGTGNDSIDVTSDGSGSWVWGDEGNDTINTHGSSAFSITGGAGDDIINLQPTGSGTDTIIFGNITYGPLQNLVSNSQGNDVINNFNFELAGGDTVHPASEDVLNFDAFLTGFNSTMPAGPGSAIKFATWTGGVNSVLDVDNYSGFLGFGNNNPDPAPPGNPVDAKVVVLNVSNSFGINDLKNALVLDTNQGDNTGGGGTVGLHMDDGSRTVVILAKDSVANPFVGYDTFEVFFVQDVDSSSDSAVWAVDLVATIHSTTAVGSTAGSIQVPANIVW